jgi:hypothetical protein
MLFQNFLKLQFVRPLKKVPVDDVEGGEAQ